MQNLNVFPKCLPNVPFQCEFSSELGMGSEWKGKHNRQSKTFKVSKILMQSTNAVHGNRYNEFIVKPNCP